jgi:predicted Zn finger-like uncharacterized protein
VKFELRCPSCANSYLIDESSVPAAGGDLPCLDCGATIRVAARAAGARADTDSDPEPARPGARPADAAARGPQEARRPETEEVVCPRCSLHFVPRRAHAEAVASNAAPRPTVLVVEDMEYFLEIARDALGERFHVETAKTLAEARAILGRMPVALMVIDLTLEGGDEGMLLLRELSPKRFPVLVFTAEDESEMYGKKWEELRALGADDLVLKGMNVGEVLLRKVGEMLGVEIDDEDVHE